jgi:hypothetical protein
VDPLSGDGLIKIDTIYVDSEKWKKLTAFAKNNTHDWKETPASYIGDINIRQENFNLLRIKNGVVLSYKDKQGKHRQLVKSISGVGLEFLKK